MTRLALHSLENAPEASRPFLERSLKNNGYLPNLVALLAGAPEALEAYLTVGELNARGALSLAEREVVQITAAVIHGCGFCTAGHSAIALKKAGFGQEAVLALHEGGATGEPRLDALASFTREIIATRGAASEAAYRAFLASDFNERQALDVVLGVSLATLCNFANNLGQPPINPELLPYSAGVLGR
ncbi:MAG TPA: carboxymuconolactone decarboxylase family protein [Polyangiaceae bacterium]|nr:carboxymuconolactone decarboxylase family protein [Polyangiaceae bacterium]